MKKDNIRENIIQLENPPITTYPSIANVLSLLWNRSESIAPWLSDHFIQIIVRPNHDDTFGDFYDHADLDNYFRIMYGAPGLDWMRVNSECAHFDTFTDYIEYEINQGYCLEACLDRFYLSFTKSYNTEHFIHSSFIYGYNREANEIYVADFWSFGKYEKKVASYKEINTAMNNNYIINLFRCENQPYTMDGALLKRYLMDYYYSRDSFSKYEFSNKQYNKKVLFGLAYYDYLLDNFRKEKIPDTRMYHILYDHKVLMKYRLEYMKSLGEYNISALETCIEKNNILIDESLKLRNGIIKYCFSYPEKMYDVLKEKILHLKKMDEELVSMILKRVCE